MIEWELIDTFKPVNLIRDWLDASSISGKEENVGTNCIICFTFLSLSFMYLFTAGFFSKTDLLIYRFELMGAKMGDTANETCKTHPRGKYPAATNEPIRSRTVADVVAPHVAVAVAVPHGNPNAGRLDPYSK